MARRFFVAILAAVLSLSAVAQGGWEPDVLGDGYECRRVEQGKDYSGRVVSTVIRKLAPDSVNTAKAVLYVHGFNDYFFQAEMGNEFVDHGYDFYAVDLRKYGRSFLQGQRRFECRSLDEYFPDVDSALVDIKRSGVHEVVLMGHSTGGLISAYFMAKNRRPDIKALVLNSPFLDWDLGWMEKIVPVVAWWGGLFPNTPVRQGDSTEYAESLLKKYHGEWTYDTGWKLVHSPDVTAGWVRAIDKAQKALRDGKARIEVPVLLMVSACKAADADMARKYKGGDAVLDPEDIRRYGCMLGPHVTCLKVYGGLHDLVLSSPAVRTALYDKIFAWLARKV